MSSLRIIPLLWSGARDRRAPEPTSPPLSKSLFMIRERKASSSSWAPEPSPPTPYTTSVHLGNFKSVALGPAGTCSWPNAWGSSSLKPTCSGCWRERRDRAGTRKEGFADHASRQLPTCGASGRPPSLGRLGATAWHPSSPKPGRAWVSSLGPGSPAAQAKSMSSSLKTSDGFHGEMDSFYLLWSLAAQEWRSAAERARGTRFDSGN